MKIHGRIKRIYMIGIGGSGMCGLAEILNSLGYEVKGSDISIESESVKHLKKLGITVYKGHKKENIGDSQVVVYSSAIKEDNPELLEAKERGLLVLRRAEMLSELMRLKFGIAVSGAHGKTTTTSIIGEILKEANFDPTIVVGGRVKALGASAKLGEGEVMVAEADESDGTFLNFFPAISVITNIDREHLDYYGSLENIKKAFLRFANSVPFYGEVIINGDDVNAREIIKDVKRNITTFGFEKGNDLRAELLEKDSLGYEEFVVYYKEKKLGKFRLSIEGKHNVMNALSAIGVALYFGIDVETIKSSLSNFKGVERRFELKYRGRISVYEDYGHHPEEIKRTLLVAKKHAKYSNGRLIVVFQPHRYTRTKALYEEFPEALRIADLVLLLPIYPAGEKPIEGVSSRLIYDEAVKRGLNNIELVEKEKVYERLETILKEGDVLMFQGAGDIRYMSNEFSQMMRRKNGEG